MGHPVEAIGLVAALDSQVGVLNQNPQNKAPAAGTVRPGAVLGSGVQPKPSELVGNLGSGLELSERSCRMRQEMGLTPQAPAILLRMQDRPRAPTMPPSPARHPKPSQRASAGPGSVLGFSECTWPQGSHSFIHSLSTYFPRPHPCQALLGSRGVKKKRPAERHLLGVESVTEADGGSWLWHLC